ncbi:MAG: hypothetical protein PHQ52_06855 [Candidatus Omnitrophica bacterium]|nr:hypothetical protein [Candidatus Omnitrophota bacterium]
MKENNSFMLQPIYHVCNKSIEHFTIFRNNDEYSRFLLSLEYYKYGKQKEKFSRYLELSKKGKAPEIDKSKQLINIYAYCIMLSIFFQNYA